MTDPLDPRLDDDRLDDDADGFGDDDFDDAPPPPPRRRRRGLRAALLVLAVLAVWVGACAVLLLRAREDAANGLASISVAERQSDPKELLEGTPVAPLEDAEASFASARNRLKNPVLTPIRWLPVLGRQLKAATAMADAAAEVTDVGAEAVNDAQAALRLPHDTPAQRIAMLRQLAAVAAEADRELQDLDLGPSEALISPVDDKRKELDEKLGKVREALGDGAVVANGLADLLQGPRRYLLLAANNAEMRGGSGMFLSAGEVRIENGEFTLGDFRPTGDLTLTAATAPPINDPDFEGRWGYLNPNREWRNLGLTPRFPASAQLATRMWPAAVRGAQPPDGVIAIDPVGLRALLKVTGPVGDVNADNVVALLTHDQYANLPPPSRSFDAVQAARREQLGLIAKSVLDRLSTGPFDVALLAESLADAVAGRHLLGWSGRPDDTVVWQRGGVDGDLGPDSLLVSVLNRGGNKLDRFLAVDADLALRPVGDEEQATLRLRLANTTPEGENTYVQGPYPGSGVGGGDYTGIVTVHVPGFAGGIAVEGFDTFTAAGPDGATQVVGVPVTLKRGESRELVFTFRLPPRGSLRIVPAARVPTIRWSAPGQRWTDDRGRTVRWE